MIQALIISASTLDFYQILPRSQHFVNVMQLNFRIHRFNDDIMGPLFHFSESLLLQPSSGAATESRHDISSAQSSEGNNTARGERLGSGAPCRPGRCEI